MGITWDSSMETGVQSVDQQHRQLIAQLNALHAAMATGQGKSAIEPILAALANYTGTHFAHEEDCMRRYGCPVAAQNINAHRKFVATFGEIEREYRAKGPSSTLVIRVQRELGDWLASHIKGTDTKLRECVKAA
jgi:hemerythrin